MSTDGTMTNDNMDSWVAKRASIEAERLHALAWHELKWGEIQWLTFAILRQITHIDNGAQELFGFLGEDVWTKMLALAKASYSFQARFIEAFQRASEMYIIVQTNRRYALRFRTSPGFAFDYRQNPKLADLRRSAEGEERLAGYLSQIHGIIDFERKHKEAGQRKMPELPELPEKISVA